ncbi:MAG: Nramp family divalent metal transporter [Verrucomicrobiales bacterium]|nr:Nramp family divalent metal transporter [Verrucomicrobiales bacterium]
MSVPPNPTTKASLPSALRSRNPLAWLTIFGPGAVIASLTIGAGELIFATRAGALFGYRLLWFFLLVLVLKWVLVYATARHMVLTGAHPFQRWMELPGPRGWLPLVFLWLALFAFPIWVGFHAGTVGTLMTWFAGTEGTLRGGSHFLWGMVLLGVITIMALAGGYQSLERTQMAIVALMLASVLVSLLVVQPDWMDFLTGFVLPRSVHYPDWIAAQKEFAGRPVWVETITYVGVLGGSGYDYLAYVSYLRDKGWGQSGGGLASAAELRSMAENHRHPNRQWLRAVWIDSTLSFLVVLIFTGVFTACGAVMLGPKHEFPTGANLLTLQSQFVMPLFPWLQYVYFTGAFLAILGTLYGTIEVAPAVLREMVLSFGPDYAHNPRLRLASVLWVGLGGFAVLVVSLLYTWFSESKSPPGLIAILTPANLFTGVLACGLISLFSVWADRKHLPSSLRMSASLTTLNIAAGIAFVALGVKGYWDHSGGISLLILVATLSLGWLGAILLQKVGASRTKFACQRNAAVERSAE